MVSKCSGRTLSQVESLSLTTTFTNTGRHESNLLFLWDWSNPNNPDRIEIDEEFTFDDLKQGVDINEEYEFDYHGETYSFSFNSKGWYLTKYSDYENCQIFSSGIELLEKGLMEGFHIHEIFDEREF